MIGYLFLIGLFLVAWGAPAPVKHFSRNFEVKLHGNMPGAYLNQKGDMAQAFALPPMAGAHFAGPITIKTTNMKEEDRVDLKVCLKQGIPPSMDSSSEWAAECQGYAVLKNATQAEVQLETVASLKRALAGGRADGGSGFVPAAKRAAAAAAEEVAAAGANFEHAWMARAGSYYLAVSTAKIVAKDRNMTVQLTVDGNTCDGADAGKFGLDNKACVISAAPLNNNQTLKAQQLAKGASQYYQFSQSALQLLANNTSYFQLTLAQDGTRDSGDLDVWVRWGGLPTAAAHDAHARAKDAKAPVTLQVPTPRMGADWFVAVAAPNATATVHYNLTLAIMQCPDAGQAGFPCAKPERLDAKAASSTVVKASSTRMTLVELPQGIEAAVGAAAVHASDPAPSLFLRWGQPPSATEFDFKDCTLASCDLARVIVAQAPNTTANRQSGQWYAGVMAPVVDVSADVLGADDDGYDVVVWNAAGGPGTCPSDCSGHGKCENYQCACEGSFGTADCSVSVGLQTWEWALIIGGGVLVAIGLIGCIVYFIQKSQRRAGFERV